MNGMEFFVVVLYYYYIFLFFFIRKCLKDFLNKYNLQNAYLLKQFDNNIKVRMMTSHFFPFVLSPKEFI